MKCKVNFISRRSVMLDAECKDTVEDILQRLVNIEGLSPESVTLYFDRNQVAADSIRH